MAHLLVPLVSKLKSMLMIQVHVKQTSSVEIERICNKADGNILETAAVSIRMHNGGPEQLVIFAVPRDGSSDWEVDVLKTKFQRAIQKDLNPLFKVSPIILSRTKYQSD